MHYGTRRICYLLLSLAVLSLLGISPVAAEEPTLARLAFWVPPERMDEFGKIYNAKVFPLLLSHGLT